MPLFHKEIGFPSKMKFRAVVGLIPSGHAIHASESDRYGKFLIPTEFDPVIWDIVEIEVENGILKKIVARKSLDVLRDVVIVFLPFTRVIKTVWINLKSDAHKTLDRSAYSKP